MPMLRALQKKLKHSTELPVGFKLTLVTRLVHKRFVHLLAKLGISWKYKQVGR
jgi:hypothetical protein